MSSTPSSSSFFIHSHSLIRRLSQFLMLLLLLLVLSPAPAVNLHDQFPKQFAPMTPPPIAAATATPQSLFLHLARRFSGEARTGRGGDTPPRLAGQ
ncbi:hypothetical protein niasHS_002873 [Heterodera schachtii]|uniref:Uncharacterized protein n=1 Tax=Heterodera schachtii TaxID=97005 RepID=A0ABD2K998_HETSC